MQINGCVAEIKVKDEFKNGRPPHITPPRTIQSHKHARCSYEMKLYRCVVGDQNEGLIQSKGAGGRGTKLGISSLRLYPSQDAFTNLYSCVVEIKMKD